MANNPANRLTSSHSLLSQLADLDLLDPIPDLTHPNIPERLARSPIWEFARSTAWGLLKDTFLCDKPPFAHPCLSEEVQFGVLDSIQVSHPQSPLQVSAKEKDERYLRRMSRSRSFSVGGPPLDLRVVGQVIDQTLEDGEIPDWADTSRFQPLSSVLLAMLLQVKFN